MSQPLGPPA